jgi:hypothetical protein
MRTIAMLLEYGMLKQVQHDELVAGIDHNFKDLTSFNIKIMQN